MHFTVKVDFDNQDRNATDCNAYWIEKFIFKAKNAFESLNNA